VKANEVTAAEEGNFSDLTIYRRAVGYLLPWPARAAGLFIGERYQTHTGIDWLKKTWYRVFSSHSLCLLLTM